MSIIQKKISNCLKSIVCTVYLLYCRYHFGHNIRLIPLAKFKFAIVDADDYDRLNALTWQARRYTSGWYAARYIRVAENKSRKMIWMHKLVIQPPPGMLIDHRNHNGLDNRKSNLRIATVAENACNRKKTKAHCTSRYKGVTFYKEPHRIKRWGAEISKNGRRIRLGRFKSESDAAHAYDEAAKKYHGEFAYLNFPD